MAMGGSARGWSGSTTCSSCAPDLGSLIDPQTVTEDLFALGFDTLKGTVERALKKIEARDDPDRAALGVAAQGIALAASLMSREFTWSRRMCRTWNAAKQAKTLGDYIEEHLSRGQADLATAFVERCLAFCWQGGTVAIGAAAELDISGHLHRPALAIAEPVRGVA